MKTIRIALFGALMFALGAAVFGASPALSATLAAVCSTATPTITPTLPNPLPTASADQGTQDNPVPLNTVISVELTKSDVKYSYDLSISQVTMGPKAVAIAKKRYSPDPPEGSTYLIAYVTGVYTSGPKDKPLKLDSSEFSSLTLGQLVGPKVILPPSPELDFTGFPGAKFKGWIGLQIDATDTAPLIALGVAYDGSGGIYFATH